MSAFVSGNSHIARSAPRAATITQRKDHSLQYINCPTDSLHRPPTPTLTPTDRRTRRQGHREAGSNRPGAGEGAGLEAFSGPPYKKSIIHQLAYASGISTYSLHMQYDNTTQAPEHGPEDPYYLVGSCKRRLHIGMGSIDRYHVAGTSDSI